MPFIKADRIKDTTTTTGTGAFALAGIVIPGSRPFNVVMLNIGVDTCEYSAGTNTGTEFETGLGTYSAANQLTRTTIYSSSNNGLAVNFSAGTKDVFMGPIASSVNDIAHGGTGATTAAAARTSLGAAASGPILENENTVSANKTITAGSNGMSVGSITVNTGITVTVGANQRWIVL